MTKSKNTMCHSRIALGAFLLITCFLIGSLFSASNANAEGGFTTGTIRVHGPDCFKILKSIARIVKNSSRTAKMSAGSWTVGIYDVHIEEIDVQGFCPGRGLLLFHVHYSNNKHKKLARQIRNNITEIMNLSKGKIVKEESVCSSGNPKFQYLCN